MSNKRASFKAKHLKMRLSDFLALSAEDRFRYEEQLVFERSTAEWAKKQDMVKLRKELDHYRSVVPGEYKWRDDISHTGWLLKKPKGKEVLPYPMSVDTYLHNYSDDEPEVIASQLADLELLRRRGLIRR